MTPHPIHTRVPRPQCVLLTTPMEVSAVARLMMVGIRLNLPAWGDEAALDLRDGVVWWGTWSWISSALGQPT